MKNKTVKVVLQGGVHTTITKDCTVLDNGSVRFNLTSDDTAIPGRYIPKLVISEKKGVKQ